MAKPEKTYTITRTYNWIFTEEKLKRMYHDWLDVDEGDTETFGEWLDYIAEDYSFEDLNWVFDVERNYVTDWKED